ncbi:hypothetical protein BH11PSE2_BH11PSE2_09300 [soil metagenome]
MKWLAVLLTCSVLGLSVPVADAATYAAPKDAYGHPDLEGIWTNATATQLERPGGVTGLTIPDADAPALAKAIAQAFYGAQDPVGGRQSEWWEIAPRLARIEGAYRTSQIVEPADGKLPYSEAGRRTQAAAMAAVTADFTGPESRPPPERCLAGGSGASSTPMFTAPYNANYKIVQTADTVAILAEALHAVRIIPLGVPRKPALEPRRWMGNSVGWWEGQTLVVETAGFNPGEQFKPNGAPYVSKEARVTERFTRTGAGEILYEYAVDDPVAYNRTWRVQTVLSATPGPMFEYACHEGNYGMEGILAGARQVEARGADR